MDLKKLPLTCLSNLLKLSLCLSLSIIGTNSSLLAQNQCGVTSSADPNYDSDDFKAFAKSFDKKHYRNTIEIPVRAHIVTRDDGKGGLPEEVFLESLEEANQMFAGSGIQFVQCGPIHHIAKNEYYELNVEDEEPLTSRNNFKDVINIYFFHTIFIEYTLLCGYASFPWMEEDFIMMANDCSYGGGILAHELGHYLGLYHTHTRLFGLEFVDGSNCDEAGDLLCDTPADPILGYLNVNENCEYNGYSYDLNGNSYQPDPENIMSYSRDECRSHFSEDQFKRMHYYLAQDRSTLYCPNVFPDLTSTDLSLDKNKVRSGSMIDVTLQVQNIGDTLADNSSVYFYLSKDKTIGSGDDLLIKQDIHSIEKAEINEVHLQMEVPLHINSGSYFVLSCLDNEFQIDELDEANNCTFTEINIDNTSLGVLNLYPNPVQDEAVLFFKNSTRGIFDVKVYSVDMKLIKYKQEYKFGDELMLSFDTNNFQKGMYFIILSRKEEQHSFKFVKI